MARFALCCLVVLIAGCAEPPTQRAAADDAARPACPTVHPPGLASAGGITRYQTVGLLTQLKRRC